MTGPAAGPGKARPPLPRPTRLARATRRHPPTRPDRREERRRLGLAFLLSLAFHALLLSLAFEGGEGVGLPGLAFFWQERRVAVPDLQVVLAPARLPPAAAPEPPSPPAQSGTGMVRPPVHQSSVSFGRARARPAKAAEVRPKAKSTARPPRARLVAATPTHPPAPPPVVVSGGEVPTPVREVAVIALEQSDIPHFLVPPGPPAPPADDEPAPPVAIPEAAAPDAVQPVTTSAGPVPTGAWKPEADAVEPRQGQPGLAPPGPDLEVQRLAGLEAKRLEEQRLAALARDEALRLEAERRESQRLEAARRQAEREEQARLAAEREAAARQEALRQEQERQESARRQAAQEEARRLEAAREEAARREAARQEAVRREAERQEAERQAAAAQQAQRVEAARAEALRLAAEREERDRQAAAADARRQEAARDEAAREAARAQSELEEDARREARRRAMGRQLEEEAARRQALAAARTANPLPLSLSSARRARLWGRADANAALVRYAEAWARKIHFNTPPDGVREVAKRPHTQPLVTVAMRSDGSVESVTFVLSSGVAEIDEAIRRIVHGHAPFPAFPPDLARDYDVVEIRRTWHFDTAIRLY